MILMEFTMIEGKKNNNGAETYYKSLKSYLNSSHPNNWKFMECLHNVITDNDLELPRLMNGHATTRGPNATTRVKRICKTRVNKDIRIVLILQSTNSMPYH